MMRIGLFLATNLAVLFIINLIITGLGLNQPGTNWGVILESSARSELKRRGVSG